MSFFRYPGGKRKIFSIIIKDIYACGDGAGTSRGITAAWCSGIRVANGILR